ncbi:hypothetical protein FVE85_3769 [Porphyridium purpureum]|uniref:Uncharacterized protein n=1 Tax=Porphyridium purpureum TaxID=35688 RepID=A0A5J4YLH2_PORPP|nr:hypothetical protein FVE85_3769 [Porphyridium purpureum]|eukprot:POR0894..scf249_10
MGRSAGASGAAFVGTLSHAQVLFRSVSRSPALHPTCQRKREEDGSAAVAWRIRAGFGLGKQNRLALVSRRASSNDSRRGNESEPSSSSQGPQDAQAEPTFVVATPMSAQEKNRVGKEVSQEIKEIEEVSPRVLVRLLSVIWIGFSLYAIVYPLQLPAAVRVLKEAQFAPELAPLVAGLIRIYLGALSLMSALVFSGFEPNHQQATEASSAFMAMALTQIAYFKRLSYPAIALAVAQLLIGIYFSGVAGKMQNDKSPPDFLREFLQAMENPDSKRLRPSAGAEAKPVAAKPADPSENASRTISFLFVALTILMVIMPQRFLRWTLSPAMLQLATSSEQIHKGVQDLVRNILSVMVIAAGRVFAPAGPPSSILAVRAARGLYIAGIALLIFARGLAGQPQIIANTSGTFLAAFFLWSAMNFSALSGRLKKQEVADSDPSKAVIDIDAK